VERLLILDVAGQQLVVVALQSGDIHAAHTVAVYQYMIDALANLRIFLAHSQLAVTGTCLFVGNLVFP
jgi:uncharacterized membrane protein YgdD (TMEM256/DUF423 family)